MWKSKIYFIKMNLMWFTSRLWGLVLEVKSLNIWQQKERYTADFNWLLDFIEDFKTKI